jgi:hypothetical protein
MSFRHFSLDGVLVLRLLQPTPATPSSNSSHHFNFGLRRLLSQIPPSLAQRTFFAGPLSSALYRDNTFQVPTDKSFARVIIRLPLHFPCLCPINCTALSLWGCVTVICFTRWGRQAPAQPPIWRTRISLLVWVNIIDLSEMGGLTSSYATGSIFLRIPWPWKPHHCVKVWIPSARSFPYSHPNYFYLPLFNSVAKNNYSWVEK